MYCKIVSWCVYASWSLLVGKAGVLLHTEDDVRELNLTTRSTYYMPLLLQLFNVLTVNNYRRMSILTHQHNQIDSVVATCCHLDHSSSASCISIPRRSILDNFIKCSQLRPVVVDKRKCPLKQSDITAHSITLHGLIFSFITVMLIILNRQKLYR